MSDFKISRYPTGIMRRFLFLILIVLAAVITSNSATAVNVGYYDMCTGQGEPYQVTAINTAGETPVQLFDLTPVDLTGVDVLWVENCDNGAYGAEYLSHLVDIENAVSNGMVVELHDRYVDPAETILPGGGGINIVRDFADDINIDVQDNTTPITNGPGGIVDNTTLDNGCSSSHGFADAATFPAGGLNILSRTAVGESVTFSYPFGSGHVIYSSIPLDCYTNPADSCDSCNPNFRAIYAPNAVEYGASLVGGGVGWVEAPDAPFLFTRFDAEFSTTTNKVYFLGGRLSDGNTDGSVWEYDPVTGIYADTGVDMPVPISNYNTARVLDSVGDEVFMIFGGRPQAGGVVNTVQGYKPGTNTVVDYTATDPYPILTSPGGAEVVNNLAYSFGGFDAVVTTAKCYIFDITAADGARWSNCPDLNLSRSYIATAVIDGVIYAAGGDIWDGVSLIAQTIVEKLDTANPVAWDDAGVADMPVACDENRGFGFNTTSGYDLAGKMVTAGCGQWPNEIAESMLYDVATDTWDQTFPDLINVRRNHAGAFIPLTGFRGGILGSPGMWVWGGRQTADTNVLATPEYFLVTQVAPTCTMFGDDFEDGILDPNWTYEKLTWTETGGNLVGTPLKRSARAIATPVFAGCQNCSVEATMSTAGGPFNKLWTYGWYIDKRNKVELLMKEENDRWVLKERVNQTIVAKQKAIATIDPNVFYDVVISFDGVQFTVTVDGTPLITMPAGAPVPVGTVGFQAKNTTGSFGSICVN